MRSRLVTAAVLVLILAVASVLRLPRLGDRPFHGDEAVHAVKFRELWEHGRYEYDPDEYHGPTIYYAALPVVAARGRTGFAETQEGDYRLAVALIGGAMVLLCALLRDGLGRAGALWAALFLALSAPFVFYSRYFIQETALAAFTLALIACWWHWQASGRVPWLMAAAVSAGLVIATKETSVLTFAALGLAWWVTRDSRRAPEDLNPQPTERRKIYLAAIFATLLVAFVLLSGFFSTPRGPLGYFETFTPWLRRAGGTEIHRHPWHYYLGLLAWQRGPNGAVWSEVFVLVLAAVGALAAVSRPTLERVGAHPGLARFVLVFSLSLCSVYSLLPYKTPWNLLSFYLGFLLLAGLGAAALVSRPAARIGQAAVALGLLLGAGQLGWQSLRTTFHYSDENTSPYAYAQPVRGVREIEARVNELVAFSPQQDSTVAQVVFTDNYYWPLPWYLRRLKNVGYWSGSVPPEPEARLQATPIVLSSSDLDEQLTERLNVSHFMIGFYGLRPGVTVQLWVKNELWEPFVNRRR